MALDRSVSCLSSEAVLKPMEDPRIVLVMMTLFCLWHGSAPNKVGDGTVRCCAAAVKTKKAMLQRPRYIHTYMIPSESRYPSYVRSLNTRVHPKYISIENIVGRDRHPVFDRYGVHPSLG